MTEYEKGYKDGMAGAALPNIIDNGDKIDEYAYSYKTDSKGVPYINIDSVRAMLTKAADVQPIKKGHWYHNTSKYISELDAYFIQALCSCCGKYSDRVDLYSTIMSNEMCSHCGARMDGDTD